MTFTSCCSISCPNDREKLDRLWGKLSSSGRQKQFQTYPNSDSRLPSSAAHPPSTTSSSASAARTQYVRSSSDYVRLRHPSVPPGTDCFTGAATRRSLSTDTTLPPTPSAKNSIRQERFLRSSRSLASFAPSLSLTSGQIVRGQTQYASFGQPGTDRFVRRLCTPLLR